MYFKVHINGKYRELTVFDGTDKIETGLLDQDEARAVAMNLIGTAASLLPEELFQALLKEYLEE